MRTLREVIPTLGGEFLFSSSLKILLRVLRASVVILFFFSVYSLLQRPPLDLPI